MIQGGFVPHGRDDILNTAIGRPKHLGRGRVAGSGMTISQYYGKASHGSSSSSISISQQHLADIIGSLKEEWRNEIIINLKEEVRNEIEKERNLRMANLIGFNLETKPESREMVFFFVPIVLLRQHRDFCFVNLTICFCFLFVCPQLSRSSLLAELVSYSL